MESLAAAPEAPPLPDRRPAAAARSHQRQASSRPEGGGAAAMSRQLSRMTSSRGPRAVPQVGMTEDGRIVGDLGDLDLLDLDDDDDGGMDEDDDGSLPSGVLIADGDGGLDGQGAFAVEDHGGGGDDDSVWG